MEHIELVFIALALVFVFFKWRQEKSMSKGFLENAATLGFAVEPLKSNPRQFSATGTYKGYDFNIFEDTAKYGRSNMALITFKLIPKESLNFSFKILKIQEIPKSHATGLIGFVTKKIVERHLDSIHEKENVIKTGSPRFDENFILTGSDTELVKKYFSDVNVRTGVGEFLTDSSFRGISSESIFIKESPGIKNLEWKHTMDLICDCADRVYNTSGF